MFDRLFLLTGQFSTCSRPVIRAKSFEPNGRYPPFFSTKIFLLHIHVRTYGFFAVALSALAIRLKICLATNSKRKIRNCCAQFLHGNIYIYIYFFFIRGSLIFTVDVQLACTYIRCSISRREIFITERECIKSVLHRNRRRERESFAVQYLCRIVC